MRDFLKLFAQVHLDRLVGDGNEKDNARTFFANRFAEAKDDQAFVLAHDANCAQDEHEKNQEEKTKTNETDECLLHKVRSFAESLASNYITTVDRRELRC